MIESSDVVINQRESNEKAYAIVYRNISSISQKLGQKKQDTHYVKDATSETTHFSNNPSRFNIDDPNVQVIAYNRH